MSNHFVDRNNAIEVSIHQFAADASDLRIQPYGGWPTQMKTNIGNGQPFILRAAGATEARYVQSAGCVELTVFND